MSENTAGFSNFTSYRQMIIDLTTDLKKLKEFEEYLKLENGMVLIDEVLTRIAEDSFDIAVVGEFKRGKSTLINALLGMDILPTDILPCSATLNRITYNVTSKVKISYRDGQEEEISIDRLPEYVTKLTAESEKKAENIKEATVYYPVNYCRNNVDIIDTPGLNDDKNMTDVTLSVLPQVDAAIVVIMAQSPFSEYERDFLENKLLTSDLGRVLFVVTGIDRYDEDDDAEKVLKSISDRIEKYVLQKAAKTLGEDSEEYAVYRKKLGKPKVFGISAKQALKGKIKGDDALLQASRFPVFEKELERFLTEDRGAILLQVPVNRILATSMEILNAIEMHEKALAMKKEEFDQKYQIALDEINVLRQKKKKELEQIDRSASTAFQKLQPMLYDFWPVVEREAIKIVDAANIDANDIKKDNVEATQERILAKVSEKAKNIGQEYSERIEFEIEKALDKEAQRLQNFSDEIAASLDRIHNIFVNSPGTPNLVVEGLVSSTILGLLGVGGFSGIWSGYRIAGLKGALVGGVGGLGGAIGAGALVVMLGIPIAWPALVVVSIVSCFTGNWLTKKMFQKENIEKFRVSIREALVSQLNTLKEEDNFTDNVREQVNCVFDALKRKVESETDTILNDTQNTLDEIKSKIERNNVMTEKEKNDLRFIAQTVGKIMENAQMRNKQLIAILDK